jgi:hypothetical protein
LALERLEARVVLSSYTFTKIADTGDGLRDFGAAPASSNAGAVAFLARPSGTAGVTSLYTGSGGPLTTIARAEAPEEIDPFPSINDGGTVAFVVRSPQGERVATGDGGPPTTLYARGDYGYYSFGPASLNRAGAVAFWASTYILSQPEVIDTGDGGPPTRIDHSESFEFTHFGTRPYLNNAGAVAYSYTFRSPAYDENAIRKGDGHAPATLYSDRDGVFSSFGDPALNDNGKVAFAADLVRGGSGIFEGDGGPVRTVALTGDVFRAFAGAPSLNAAGEVAFAATLADGTGIFTGPDPVADRVIATGDELSGSVVTDVGFFRQGLNDAGQVAFFARLANGTEGVFRADPLPPGPRAGRPAPQADVVADLLGAGFRPETGTLTASGAAPQPAQRTPEQVALSATRAGAGLAPLNAYPGFTRPLTGVGIATVSGSARGVNHSPSFLTPGDCGGAAVDALFQGPDQGWAWPERFPV